MFKVGIRAVRFNSTLVGMTWQKYLALKKQNSRINTVMSAFTAAGGALATLSYMGNLEIDPEKTIFGIDPLMFVVGAVLAGGFGGFLAGPVIGNPVFRLMNRNQLAQFRTRDRQFLERIKLRRVDPSSQSMSNPVPDYYGERIYSLADYKQWLRDCNAFKRKAKEFL